MCVVCSSIQQRHLLYRFEREVREAINVAYKLIISEKNKKRDIRDWYQQQQSGSDRYRDQPDGNNDIYRRGDIPVLHGDCDGE